MAKNISIGEAELEIMKVLWSSAEPVTTADINAAVADKGWKRTTISTFLGRLAEKGAVVCEKKGNSYLYSPLITKSEYRRAQTQNLIASLYEGSVAFQRTNSLGGRCQGTDGIFKRKGGLNHDRTFHSNACRLGGNTGFYGNK